MDSELLEEVVSGVRPLRRGAGGGGGFFLLASCASVSEEADILSWLVGGAICEAEEKLRKLDGLLGFAGGACLPLVSNLRISSTWLGFGVLRFASESSVKS